MKLTLQILFILFSTFSLVAQTSVDIKINHLLNAELYENNKNTTNDLGNDFMIDRLQYYLSGFSIIHDGGQKTEVEDLYVLVGLMQNSDPTVISLGTFDIDVLEGVNFYFGVDEEANHADPSLWPSGHPLAPAFPSMHWGWSAGYRFIALEGMSGPNLNQNLEFHCIGDEFYKEFQYGTSGLEGDNVTLELEADYAQLLTNIDVSSGLILHGNLGEIQTLASNFMDNVFTKSVQVSVEDNEQIESFTVSPNPSNNGLVYIDVDTQLSGYTININDALGRQVTTMNSAYNGAIQIENSGLYYVSIVNKSGEVLATRKVIVQ